MEGNYPIVCCGRDIGTAQVHKQGLFYCIRCRCTPPNHKHYTISLVQGADTKDLGLCVPYGEFFGLDTRISAKTAGQGSPRFILQEKHHDRKITLTLPFADLSLLTKGRFCRSDGVPMLILTSAAEKPDNDQSP